MDKTKPNAALNGNSIGKEIAAKMKRSKPGKAVDASYSVEGYTSADEWHRAIKADKEFACLPPAFAAYMCTQVQVSMITEKVLGFKEMAPIGNLISEAENLYMPQGPPMSPLSSSYFTFWALFDACGAGQRDYRHDGS